MWKKSFLTILFVFVLGAILIVPSFAVFDNTGNLINPSFLSWTRFDDFSNMSPLPIISFSTNSGNAYTNTINFTDSTVEHSYFISRVASDINLDMTYTLDFDYWGYFNSVNMHCYIIFSDNLYDLNNYNEVFEIHSNISSSSPRHFHVQFKPSQFVTNLNTVSIAFGFERKAGSNTNLYVSNLKLTDVNPVDAGSWTGGELDLSEPDISNDISNFNNEGASILTFLVSGFSSIRASLVVFLAYFKIFWDYISTYFPKITWVICFGLFIGLLLAIINGFSIGGKSSGGSSDRGSSRSRSSKSSSNSNKGSN